MAKQLILKDEAAARKQRAAEAQLDNVTLSLVAPTPEPPKHLHEVKPEERRAYLWLWLHGLME